MAVTNQATAAQDNKQAIVSQKEMSDKVLARVKKLEENKQLVIPKDYVVENHLKAAWLNLQEVKDKNDNYALQVCTEESIANALLDMVLQGLSSSKKQCYFVVHGKKLTLMRSYFGTMSVARRAAKLEKMPVANVVYKDDEFEYTIDPATGLTHVLKHVQKISNIDFTKIVGAYAIVTYPNGDVQTTIMSFDQIKKAWGQGATKGTSGAHTNFTDEMCKKTVINRACKAIINSSDDAWLYDGTKDEADADARDGRNEIVAQAAQAGNLEDVEYVEVEPAKPAPAAQPAPAPQAAAPTAQTAPADGLFNSADPF